MRNCSAGIDTSIRAASAPRIAANAGKKVCQIFPDFAFGYDHRDYLPPALKAQGADVIAQIAIPPTESSFTRYFPQIPADTDVTIEVETERVEVAPRFTDAQAKAHRITTTAAPRQSRTPHVRWRASPGPAGGGEKQVRWPLGARSRR